MATTKKSIGERLRERCKEFTTSRILPVEDTRDAVDGLTALEASLKDLADYIAANAPKDEPGHDLE